jgi:hypothetical protein
VASHTLVDIKSLLLYNNSVRLRTHLDYDRLRLEIQNMNRQKMLYKILKEELSALGFWKNRVRGNPKLGYKMRGKKEFKDA